LGSILIRIFYNRMEGMSIAFAEKERFLPLSVKIPHQSDHFIDIASKM
jgi:hypothetical protein